MDNKDKMQRELMSKLAELESKHKRRLPPDDIHLRLRRDMDKAQKDTPVISKELFCTAIHLLKEQESIDDEFGRALQKVGNGHFAYGTENKYRKYDLYPRYKDFNGVLACFSTGQIPPSKQQRTCYKVFKATLFAISKSGYCAHSAHNAEHKFAGFHNKTDASAGKAKIPLFILEKMCYNSIAKFF